MPLNGDDLGDAMRVAVMAEVNSLDQSSDPADAGDYQTARFRAMGNAIVSYFKTNATIESLSCNQTTAGDPPHTHNVSTVEATGKIK
jgi:hypothetical protein